MVQVAKIAIALTTVFSGFGLVAAKSCRSGGVYCGSALLKRGDYITKIKVNLIANGQPTTDYYVEESLWTCLEHGDITLEKVCSYGCSGGDKRDDTCNEVYTAVKRDNALPTVG
ncbi:hypothetical protein F5X99DRAFT_314953 [Biscogniauxia marginata]|nr:hypothetical protein F5X99DRAFT_314953 [Biscogniauxia marginata]